MFSALYALVDLESSTFFIMYQIIKKQVGPGGKRFSSTAFNRIVYFVSIPKLDLPVVVLLVMEVSGD